MWGLFFYTILKFTGHFLPRWFIFSPVISSHDTFPISFPIFTCRSLARNTLLFHRPFLPIKFPTLLFQRKSQIFPRHFIKRPFPYFHLSFFPHQTPSRFIGHFPTSLIPRIASPNPPPFPRQTELGLDTDSIEDRLPLVCSLLSFSACQVNTTLTVTWSSQ